MKLPLITLLFIMACVVNIAATPRKQVCPLQCYCNKRPDLWIDVSCPGSNFSSVPQFPDRTITVNMKHNGKLGQIQSYAFSNLLHLQKLYLQSVVPWRLGLFGLTTYEKSSCPACQQYVDRSIANCQRAIFRKSGPLKSLWQKFTERKLPFNGN